ncbi:hypothetical protein C5167_004594 [Papaver somniferum]|uniref:Uncharacterized protein n=2 Tax=Papaver somniferum TaxID=3469 RepID=A0A4Y7JBL4_PAPSO|nr:hypothetical protein C5167_004594 [Papaver somniferum]
MAKSSTPDDGGGGTLSMTVSLTNGPVAAAYPIPDEKIDPPALPNQSKSWHMPLWGWILIGFAIFAFFLVVTWVVWYYCSHRAASQTAGNQNGSTELDDIESLSSSTIDNIYSNIFRVPNPDASATPPRDPAILPNRARPWQAIFSVILLIAGAIWYYYSHCGDTEPDKPSQST